MWVICLLITSSQVTEYDACDAFHDLDQRTLIIVPFWRENKDEAK